MKQSYRGEMADDKSSLRVASFSYYLDTAKDNNMLHKISAQEIPMVLSSAPPRNPSLNSNKNTLTDLREDSCSYLNDRSGEIGVFGADNYFRLDYQTGLKRDLKNVETPAAGARPNSTRSEVSSYNRRVALLPINLQRNGSQAKQKKGINARRIFLGFGCQGPCFDKKGVHINQLVAEEAYIGSITTRAPSERIDHLDSRVENNLEESRNSIEVFGAGAAFKGEVAKNMERKLSMLTWDAIPEAQNTATSIAGSGVVGDDVASDASSDLFEIENISGAAHPIMAADDDASICMSPASHYAPSEASIQWSVVTASAIDYPAVSDYNDDMSVSVAGDVMARSINKEAQKGRHGGILGCRSQKAVDVVQNVTCKNLDRAKHQQTLKY